MRALFAVLLLSVAGCGGSVDLFVGRWLVTNSDGTNLCPVPSDITGTQDIFTLAAADGELVRDNCKLRLSVSGDRASLGAPADCDYGPFTSFHYRQFDLQTTDGKSISGTVVGLLDGNSPGCTISAHFSGAHTTR